MTQPTVEYLQHLNNKRENQNIDKEYSLFLWDQITYVDILSFNFTTVIVLGVSWLACLNISWDFAVIIGTGTVLDNQRI